MRTLIIAAALALAACGESCKWSAGCCECGGLKYCATYAEEHGPEKGELKKICEEGEHDKTAL